MKTTLQLFGKPKSHYEPETTILATKRIDDGLNLLKILSSTKHLVPDEFIKDHINTYQATEKAIKHWREILEEE